MGKYKSPRQALISLLTAICFIFAIAIPFVIPVAVEAATPASATNTVSGLAQAAIQDIKTLLQSPQSANDPTLVYTAYVLALAGQNATTTDCVYNGTSCSLESYVEASASYIVNDSDAVTDSADYSAKLIAYEILALNKWGQTGLAGKLADILAGRQITSGSEQGSFDGNLYSDMPALAALGTAGDMKAINQVYARGYVLGTQSTSQATYGCWGTSWSGTYYPDFLSTAWAIEALSDLSGAAGNSQIQTAVKNALAWMQQQQAVDGSVYCNNGMDDPVVDTAQTIITLEALGTDPATWVTSQGNSPVTYMLSDALNAKGGFGTSGNLMDAAWALQAYLLLGGSGGGTTGTGTNPSSSGTCTVSLAVVGGTGGLLYGPGTVTVSSSNQWGLTVLGALDASPLTVTMSTAYQGFVESIDGETDSGMNGWMYEVNGTVGSVAAGQEPISSGDRIIWWYSTSGMNSTAPNWNDLLTSTSATGTTGSNTPASTSTAATSLVVTGLPAALQPSSSDLTALEALVQSAAGQQDFLGESDKFGAVVGTDNPMGITQLTALGKQLSNNAVNLSQMIQASSGATLTDPRNQLALYIPPGALSSDTDITAGNNPGNQAGIPSPGVPDIQEISPVYNLGPTGTTFSTPVTLILKVAIPPLVRPQNVCLAWYDESSNKWVIVPSVVDATNGLIIAQITHFSKYALFAQVPKKSFADVTSSFSWAQQDIEALAGAGIVAGVDATHFEPSLPVTRAQLATILVRALRIKETAVASHFKDVTKEDWYAQAVNAVYAKGLVTGFPDGKFYPDEPVTREEMAVILARSLNLQPPAKEGQKLPFRDSGQISPWAISSVSAAVADGLIKGLPNGTFSPRATLDRAEAAVLVYRVLMLK